MNIEANPEVVINNLTNQIAKLIKENAFYAAALTENQAKMKELEESKNAPE